MMKPTVLEYWPVHVGSRCCIFCLEGTRGQTVLDIAIALAAPILVATHKASLCLAKLLEHLLQLGVVHVLRNITCVEIKCHFTYFVETVRGP